MTKKQATSTRPAGITQQRVVDAALRVLDRGGVAALSTRAVAADLGVSMNTVLWHIGTKRQLLELMAEAILGDVDLDGLPEPWADEATELVRRLRRAMLGHRDGARVVAGTFPAEPNTLAFADRVAGALLRGCPTSRTAAWTTWNLFYFALGLTQEEQATASVWNVDETRRPSLAELPGLRAIWSDFTRPDFDQRFEFGLDQILRSAATPTDDGPDG